MNFLQYRPTTLVLVIVICLAVVLAIQIIYYFCVYGKLIFNKKKKQTEDTGSQTEALPPVSVVIAAKNEEYHLKDKLVFFLEQDYPEFEVIVVNDASTDECEYVLKAFSKLYPCLKVVNIVENVNKFRGRKFPISLGIKSAKYDHIVLAGADCVPSGFEWLKNLARNFSEKKEVVLGFCTYTKQKGLFKFLLQYDNLTTAMNYMGLALSGHPYRGDGRNIAFKKDLFFKVGGFTKHYNLPLGEDDIFIRNVSTASNTTVSLTPESFLSSDAKHTYKEWKRQKINRLSTYKYYKPSIKFLLSIPNITTLLFYAFVITLLLLSLPFEYVILAIVIKFVLQILIYFKSCKRLGIKRVFIFAPLIELYFLLLNAELRLLSLFRKKK